MTILVASEFGTDISSRSGASRLRNVVVGNADASGPVELDFAGVRTLSESFADELFAILVVQKGEGWFKEHVKVLNLSDHVRQSILEAVQDRLSGMHR